MCADSETSNVAGRSRGFSLVELVTVLSMTSVLGSLLVPAVQTARMSARDLECRNRLKEIGLAAHNYHDVYLMFPPGWNSRRTEGEGHPSTGWQTSLLPFLDHANLFHELNVADCVYEPKNDDFSALKTPIAKYRCSFDSLGDTNPLRGGWGTSNFAGNYGPHPIGRWSESAFWPGQSATIHSLNPVVPDETGASRVERLRNRNQHWRATGVFRQNAGVRIRDIVDGTSNTLMVGEKSVIGRGGIWPGPRSNFHESDVVADASHASGLNRSDTGFSSRHIGGVVTFVLCDGSARRIEPSIASGPPETGNPAGGLLQIISGCNDGQATGRW